VGGSCVVTRRATDNLPAEKSLWDLKTSTPRILEHDAGGPEHRGGRSRRHSAPPEAIARASTSDPDTLTAHKALQEMA